MNGKVEAIETRKDVLDFYQEVQEHEVEQAKPYMASKKESLS